VGLVFPQLRLDHRRVDVEQDRKGTDIDDVLEQLALARIGIGLVADVGQRHRQRIGHDLVVASDTRALQESPQLGGQHIGRDLLRESVPFPSDDTAAILQ